LHIIASWSGWTLGVPEQVITVEITGERERERERERENIAEEN
jgi:hypothetical protein